MVVLSIEPINSFWGWGTMKEFGGNWLGHIPPLLGRRGGIIWSIFTQVVFKNKF